MKRDSQYIENIKCAFSIVWGQCSEALRVRLEAKKDHEMIALDGNVIDLLEKIKDVTYSYQSK